MFRGLSIKIWLPFTVLSLVITIAFNLYYPKKQEVFYIKNKNNELKELAKTVGLGVELSINEDNFQGLKKTLDFASGRKDFEFIAIVLNDNGEESVFTSYPILPEKDILTKKTEKYIYQRSKFSSDEFQGYILIAASKLKMSEELTALNRPVYFSTFIIFFFTFFTYVAIARRITRPLNKLVKITEDMRIENFNNFPLQDFTRDEIGTLGQSIYDLQKKLIEQRNKNKELYDGLEDEIKQRTKELEQATNDLIESQSAASLANYSMNIDSGKGKFPELFFKLLEIDPIEYLSLESLKAFEQNDDHVSLFALIDHPTEGSNFKKELRFISSSGNSFWLSISGLIKRDVNSSNLMISGLMQDITERKNYENEIKRLSLVAQNTSNCVIITDANRKMIWINESTLKITGYSRDELIGKSPKMFQCEKTDQRTTKLIREKLKADQSVNCEILNRSKDGREYWLELNIVPLFNESNDLYGYIAVETDITPIKEASLELEEREKQLRNILDNSSEMIHTLDKDGNVLWANKSWIDNLNVTDATIINRNISEFLDDQTKLEFQEVMPKLMAGESVNDLSCGFISTGGELIYLKGQTIPLFKDDQFIGSQAYLANVTQIVKAERELKMISNMQKILMDISFDFLNVDPIDTKEIVLKSIKKIGTFMQVELISTINLLDEKSILNYDLKQENSTKLPQSEIVNRIQIGEINSNENTSSKNNLIQNRLLIPLMRDNNTIGDLMLMFPPSRIILSQEIELLKLYASMLVNIENRYLSASELSEAKKEIEVINSNLESKVLENTKRNLDLSKTIVEQEKMATIGEISAGIAHDLNTPLGSIKIGAESIGYSLETIFKLSPLLSQSESKLLLELARERKIEVFVGGFQLMRESKNMIEFLQNDIGLDDVNLKKTADLFVKCRITKDDKNLILQIMRLNNTDTFLEMLFTVLTTYSMLSSVGDSVTRATDVVQNIRSFIKKDISSGIKRKEINLKENIRIVLNIFNYEFKKNMNLEVDLADQLIIKGFDVKLFQLWSNLIKNAIDAMEKTTDKRLIIKGFEKEDSIVVSISNNGEMIPLEIQDRIFKKFFSTKKEKNGTGLGLSIVQSVIHEHSAQITLNSTEELTTFTVQFKKNN
jgi:PAS domain S-box-containing protein